ncbi:hypothetical protein FRC17_010757 [Serendipita sp. 399]|nr:hypothetical protein FRC17_010757 [Serendipita sp. 399]
MSTAPTKASVTRSVDLPIEQARWITLKKIEWKDQEGKERTWEMAERKTRTATTGVDAVAILALLSGPNVPLSTVIIEQFRPPVNAYAIELPAGLIDPKDTLESCAFRELEEETGFKAESVVEVSPLMVCDPGMTSANMKLIVLRVPISESDMDSSGSVVLPQQKLEDGEHIVRRVVELSKLKGIIDDYTSRGFVVDARLSHFISGWEMASRLQNGLL